MDPGWANLGRSTGYHRHPKPNRGLSLRGVAWPIKDLPCLKSSPTWSNHVQPCLCGQFWDQRPRGSFQPISLRRVAKLTSDPCGPKITIKNLGRPQDARDRRQAVRLHDSRCACSLANDCPRAPPSSNLKALLDLSTWQPQPSPLVRTVTPAR